MQHKFIKLGCMLLCIILLSMVGFLTVAAQQDQTQTSYIIFLPGVFNNQANVHSISGQVFNQLNHPVAGVTMRTDSGQVAFTDLNGAYSFNGLAAGEYVVTPSFGSVKFSPISTKVVVPPDVTKLNFTAQVACSEALVNGGFEGTTGWQIPDTAFPAGYSSAEAHSGTRSMRTGIVNPADNALSYSSVHQKVSLPANTANAYLTFWIKPSSGGTTGLSTDSMPQIGTLADDMPMSGDVQYVLVLDKDMKIVKTLLWQLSNDRSWTLAQFNLNMFTGQTIWLHFGTYNDGLNGVSSMYVDDVSLSICSGSGTPTPGPCTNLFDNSGFETTGDWQIPLTAYPAAYSTAKAHTGNRSMRTGIVNAADNIYSYSDFRQAVYIPSGVTAATARFWLYTLSPGVMSLSAPEMIDPSGGQFTETVLSGDLQYVLVLDQDKNWIDTLVWQHTDDGYWHYYEFSLRRYAGRTIYLQFGTYNDGLNGISSMYVDDASLDDCATTPTPTPSPTPTPTPTPAPCQELIINNKFDGNTGWKILNTGYPAGYSNVEYHSPFRSMRTGIVSLSDNLLSYSDFRQVVTIPSTTRHVSLGMWLYFISGETGNLSQPAMMAPSGRAFVETTLSDDVQYMLILDGDQNWIDTLVWQRSNTKVWTSLGFDLSAYAGRQIMLQWGSFNNGLDGRTAMFVDDVTLQACP